MAMRAERSKPPLHNFNLPCGLKWGNQKFLRCVKVQSNDQISTVHRLREPAVVDRYRSNPNNSGEGIEAVKETLMFDHKINDASFRQGLEGQPGKNVTDSGDLSRPWNLRTRRTACKEPIGFDINRTNNALSPLRTENKSPKLRSGAEVAGASTSGEKRERVKFSVPLSRGEIEEDFMAMIRHRPPRRPKKRARLVQKNLDTLFPGLWLTKITADLYKVSEDQ